MDDNEYKNYKNKEFKNQLKFIVLLLGTLVLYQEYYEKPKEAEQELIRKEVYIQNQFPENKIFFNGPTEYLISINKKPEDLAKYNLKIVTGDTCTHFDKRNLPVGLEAIVSKQKISCSNDYAKEKYSTDTCCLGIGLIPKYTN